MNEGKTTRNKWKSFTTVIDKWVHGLVLTNSLTDLTLIVNRKMKHWIAMSTIIIFTT